MQHLDGVYVVPIRWSFSVGSAAHVLQQQHKREAETSGRQKALHRDTELIGQSGYLRRPCQVVSVQKVQGKEIGCKGEVLLLKEEDRLKGRVVI